MNYSCFPVILLFDISRIVNFFEHDAWGVFFLVVLLPILALVIPIVIYLLQRPKIMKQKAKDTTFRADELKEKSTFFFANDFVGKSNRSVIRTQHLTNKKVSPLENLDYFINQIILKSDHKLYFIEAGTGIGKTTFLTNLYIHYNSLDLLMRDKSKLTSIFLFFANWMKSGKWKFWRKKPKMILIKFSGLSVGIDRHSILSKYCHISDRENVILLIDGMDEFSSLEGLGNYWAAFKNNWKVLSPDLQQFGKVIISVREQFFDQDIANIFMLNQDFNPKIIQLLPFSDRQADWFLKAKFGESPYYAQIEGLMSIFRYKKYDFAHIPLILNYMDEIVIHYNKVKNISRYEIYNAIVTSWIEREAQDKIGGYDIGKKAHLRVQIRDFCRELAYRIYRNQAENGEEGYTIGQNELKDVERLSGLEESSLTFNSRSLLIKEILEMSNVDRINSVEYYRFGFIHKAFLEFFLLEYQLEQEKIEIGSAHKIDFTNHTLAYEMYVIKKWNSLKAKNMIPDSKVKRKNLFPPEILIAKPDENATYNYVTIELLKKWLFFFDEFTWNNNSIKELLQKNGIIETIRQIDSSYMLYFSTFSRGFPVNNEHIFCGVNNNFWDYDRNRPYLAATCVLPFFANFIDGIYFLGILIKDNDFDVFKNTHNIEGIYLENCPLVNKVFDRFTQNRKLSTLSVKNCPLDDFSFFALSEMENLTTIEIENTLIDGKCLKYFLNSKNSIREVRLAGNTNFKRANLEHVLAFNELEILTIDKSIFSADHPIFQEFRSNGVEVNFREA